MTPDTMRAAVIAADTSQAEVVTVPVPVPAADEALVRVRAAALNRMDLMMLQAGSRAHPGFILGGDAVAEVVSAPAASGLQEGQRVAVYPAAFCGQCPACLRGEQTLCRRVAFLGLQRSGTFAEYLALPARSLVPLESSLSDTEAAALPVAYLTAWNLLFGGQPLRTGETVLIHGIGGGVSVACLQLACLAGARAIVTSSADEKLRRAEALGAWVAINYSREDVAKRVHDATGGRGVDLVVDNVGEATFPVSLRCVAAGGRIATCGVTSGATASLPLARLLTRQISIRGVTLGSVGQFQSLLNLAAEGKLKPVVEAAFSLTDVREALAQLSGNRKFGKLVLTV